MSDKDRVWYLMSRSVNNEASQQEREALQRLLEEDGNLKEQYEILCQYWKRDQSDARIADKEEKEDDSLRRILFLANTADNDKEELVEPISAKEKSSAKVIRWVALASTAAACLLFFIMKTPFGVGDQALKASGQLQVINTPKGTRIRTILPDGSVVWLNSGSKISFNDNFKGPVRDVTLEGEAYFDVAKSFAKPFIVHVANIDIRVLGTAFNVRSYACDSATETTLVNGLLQIAGPEDQAADKQKFIIHPNEKISILKKPADLIASDPAVAVDKANSPVLIRKVDTSLKIEDRTEVAWVYNRLIFRGESFPALAARMERWYNVKIVFEDEKVRQLSFNGSFENENVTEAFKALKAAIPFNYKIQDHEVYVSSAD